MGVLTTFFREHRYRALGFETVEELLVDWEKDHVLGCQQPTAKLRTWQCADISAGPIYNSDFDTALGAISAQTGHPLWRRSLLPA